MRLFPIPLPCFPSSDAVQVDEKVLASLVNEIYLCASVWSVASFWSSGGWEGADGRPNFIKNNLDKIILNLKKSIISRLKLCMDVEVYYFHNVFKLPMKPFYIIFNFCGLQKIRHVTTLEIKIP